LINFLVGHREDFSKGNCSLSGLHYSFLGLSLNLEFVSFMRLAISFGLFWAGVACIGCSLRAVKFLCGTYSSSISRSSCVSDLFHARPLKLALRSTASPSAAKAVTIAAMSAQGQISAGARSLFRFLTLVHSTSLWEDQDESATMLTLYDACRSK